MVIIASKMKTVIPIYIFSDEIEAELLRVISFSGLCLEQWLTMGQIQPAARIC